MCKNGKWGYVDSAGKTAIPFQYDAVPGYKTLGSAQGDTPFVCSEGYVTVYKNGRFGVLAADGTQIIPCQYPYLTPVHDGRAFASKDGKTWGVLCVDSKISDGVRTTTAQTAPEDSAEDSSDQAED